MGVASLEVAERDAGVLVENGYGEVDWRYREIWPERIASIRRERGTRQCDVHAMLGDHRVWQRLIAFRDDLRRHPATAAEYAALKRSLADALGTDRHADVTAKGDFINRVTDAALRGTIGPGVESGP